MKKIISTSLVIFVTAFFTLAQAQSLNEVLDKHFKTIGQEKKNSVKSFIIKAKLVQNGMELPVSIKMKRPDKFRMEMDMQGQKMVQVINGEKGWMIVPWMSSEVMDLTGEQLKQIKTEADIDGVLYNYKEKKLQLELIGKENLDGTEVFNIKVGLKNGDVQNYFIDAEKYVIVGIKGKISTNGQEFEVVQHMSNYKNIEGVLVEMKVESVSPMGTTSVIKEEMIFNEEIDDSVFARPEK